MNLMSENGITHKFIEYLEGLKNAEPLQEKIVHSISENISTESCTIEQMYWLNVFDIPMKHLSKYPDLKTDDECRSKFIEYLKRGIELYDRIIKIVRLKVNSFTSTYAAHTMVTSSDRLYLECASRSFVYIGHLYFFMLNITPNEDYFKHSRDSYIRAFIIDPSSDLALFELAKLYSYVSDQFSSLFYYFKGSYGVSNSQHCLQPLDNILETYDLTIKSNGISDIQKMKIQLILVLKQLYRKDTFAIDPNLYEELTSIMINVIVNNIGDSSFLLDEEIKIENGRIIEKSPLDTIVTMVFTILLIGLDRLRKIDSQRFLDVLKLYSNVFFKLLEMISNYINNILIMNNLSTKMDNKSDRDTSTQIINGFNDKTSQQMLIDECESSNIAHKSAEEAFNSFKRKAASFSLSEDDNSSDTSIQPSTGNEDEEKTISLCESEDEQPKPIEINLNFEENDDCRPNNIRTIENFRTQNHQEDHMQAITPPSIMETSGTEKNIDFRYCFLKVIKLTIDWLRCWPDATSLIKEVTGLDIINEIKRVVDLLPVPFGFAGLAHKDHLSPEDLLCLGHPLFSRLHKNLDYNFDTFISLEGLYDKDDLHRIAYLKKVVGTARIFRNGYLNHRQEHSNYDSHDHGRNRKRYSKRSFASKRSRDFSTRNNVHNSDNDHLVVEDLTNDVGKISLGEKGLFKVNDLMKKIIAHKNNNLIDHNSIGRVNIIMSYSSIFDTQLIRQMIFSKRFRIYVPIVVLNKIDDLKKQDNEAKRVSRFLYENCYPKFIGFRVQSYEESHLLPRSKIPKSINTDTFRYLDSIFQTALYKQLHSDYNESSIILMTHEEYIDMFGYKDSSYSSTNKQTTHRQLLLDVFSQKDINLITVDEFKEKYFAN